MAPWNIHRVYLDTLPNLDLSKPKSHDWVRRHLLLVMKRPLSALTRNLNISDSSNVDLESDLRMGLRLLILDTIGIRDIHMTRGRKKVFYIHSTEDLTNGILLLVSAVKFDISNQTVVLDTCAVVSSSAFQLAEASKLEAPNAVMYVKSSENGMKAWRQLLPAVVERCRTWTHDPATCEYLQPVDPQFPFCELGPSELCSCAAGKVPAEVLKLKQWGLGKLVGAEEILKKDAMRAAVSPMFPSIFEDEVESESRIQQLELPFCCVM